MVRIAIYYNGGYPHYHTVSSGFYDRFMRFLDTPPHNKADVVVQVIERCDTICCRD